MNRSVNRCYGKKDLDEEDLEHKWNVTTRVDIPVVFFI